MVAKVLALLAVICAFLLPVATTLNAEGVNYTYMWHMHMPNFWGWADVKNGAKTYHKLIWYKDNKAQSQIVPFGKGDGTDANLSGHPLDALFSAEYFGKDDKRECYHARPKNALASVMGQFADIGAQVSFSGALIFNMHELGTGEDLGFGQNYGGWGGYSSTWYNSWREANAWKTTHNFPRMDMVYFTFHHSIGSLAGDEVLEKELLIQHEIQKQNYAWGPGHTLSKGFFPTENVFSTRMIPVLSKLKAQNPELDIQWVFVPNTHLARASVDYPNHPSKAGYNPSKDNTNPPNEADMLNNPGDAYRTITISRGCSPTANYPFAYTPHRAKYVDPATGTEYFTTVVPTAQGESWNEGYSMYGTGEIDSIASANNASRPMLVAFTHDGDNSWQGGWGYYGENVPSFAGQAKAKGYNGTTVSEYLSRYPVPATDVVHVEDGGWVNEDTGFGDPQSTHWNWPVGAPNFDPVSGWAEDQRNWGVLTAGLNYVLTAEKMWKAAGGVVRPAQILLPGNDANLVEKAWHFLLAGYDSGFMYYGWNASDILKPSLAVNLALYFVKSYVEGNPALDQQGPTVYIPQRFPYNPGGYGFGSSHGYKLTKNPSDFWVYTFVHDSGTLGNVTLKFRTDKDGKRSLSNNENETYAGGAGVNAWQSLSMSTRTFPQGYPGAEAAKITQVAQCLPDKWANLHYAKVTGLSNVLVDYYVEAVDAKGNVTRSPIQHVYVGDGGSAPDPGGAVTLSPAKPVVGGSVEVTYKGSLKDEAAVTMHWGYDAWKGVTDTVMAKQADGSWKATVTVPAAATTAFDVVFKNGTSTKWDNNGGADWHYAVTTWSDDAIAPYCQLTSPVAGATVSGQLSLVASATDNKAVSKVEFAVNGVVKNTDTTAPWECTVDTTAYTNGGMVVSAKAFDAAGNVKESVLSVNVANNLAPTVNLTAPAAGSVISGSAAVAATAADDKGVAKVEFFVNGILKATDTTVPYGFTFDTTTVTNGAYVITAKASDAEGLADQSQRNVTVNNVQNTVSKTVHYFTASTVPAVYVQHKQGAGAWSAYPGAKMTAEQGKWTGFTRTLADAPLTVRFTLAGGKRDDNGGANYTLLSNESWISNRQVFYSNPADDKVKPTVIVTAPTNGATLKGTLALKANAADNKAVTKVEFYVDGQLKATDTTAPYAADWTTTVADNGSHTVLAKACDAAGNFATDSVTITVNNIVPDNAPVVSTFTVPAGNLVGTASFSAEASDDKGVAKVEFFLGATKVGEDTTAPYALSFDSKLVANGPYTARAVATDTIGQTNQKTASVTVLNPSTLKLVHYKTVWTTVNMHYKAGAAWTTPPGLAMAQEGATQWWSKSVDCAGELEFVFNNGTTWDNNNNLNYKSTLPELWVKAGVVYATNPEPVNDDTIPPTVGFTSPAENAVVSNNVTLAATATDNKAVTKVEFYAGAALVGTATAAPYQVTWSSKSVGNGALTLTAKAYDAAGNIGTAGRSVTVQNAQGGNTWPGTYSGKLGANVYDDGVEFSVWWRGAVVTEVSAVGTFNAWNTASHKMTRISGGANDDVWYVFVPGATVGQEYKFAGKKVGATTYTTVADVYSKYNRYSNGNSVIVRDAFAWTDQAWTRPEWKDYIIYELHIQDFTKLDTTVTAAHRGKYLGVKEKLQYLKDLGITAIELMPPSEFGDAGFSWGYNTSLYRSIESGYAVNPALGQEGLDQMKDLINTAHSMGIAVIFDMVFNHVDNADNWFWQMDNVAYFDFNGNGNPADDQTPWGNKFNTPHPVVKRYAKDVCEYFMRELHVDGFRYDATHTDFMDHGFIKELKGHLSWVDPKVFFTMENLPNQSDIKTFGSQWAAEFRHRGKDLLCEWNSIDASYFAKHIFYTKDHGWSASPVETLNYLESHDEDSLAYLFGLKSYSADTMRYKTKLGAVTLACSLGVPMLMSGQEVLSSRKGQPADPRPLDWSLLTTYRDVYDFYAYVLKLRRDNPALRLATESGFTWQYTPWTGDTMVAGWSLSTGNAADKKFVIVCNYASSSRTVSVGFPENGTWTKVVDGPTINGTATVNVTGNSSSVTLQGSSAAIFMK